ncbi:MAG: glycosyltransferase family 2 protein [Rhizobacter sp.]|nr:glycosyltransferase family 2 protein [Rhizobacter sp.]
MKFSLIMGTLGRRDEVGDFLASLQRQDHRDFELLIVDQNPDERLAPLVAHYRQHFRILRYRSAPGLSRARNVGLRYATGEVIAFPDDDCWYPDGLLSYVAGRLQAEPSLDGLTGRFVDAEGRSEGRWLPQSQPLTPFNVWRGAISFSIFLRRRLVERVGGFDELLGVGAGTPWGAGEETDFLLRGMRAGAALEYDHDLVLHHPVKTVDFGSAAIARQCRYEAGFGRVIRRGGFPGWYFPWVCGRTLAGSLLALCRGRSAQARFKWHSVIARVGGWRSGLQAHGASPSAHPSSTNA